MDYCEVSFSMSLTSHCKILMKSMKNVENGGSVIFQTSKIQLNGGESTIQELAFDPIDQLQLMVDPENPKDREQLNMILRGILNYPSSQLAEIHSDAMKLGNHDLEESKDAHNQSTQKIETKIAQVCGCCGFRRQEQSIKMCTSIDSISNIGTSTCLFFATFKNLSILLVIMTAVYSIYSLSTNIIAAKNNAQGNNYAVDYLTISLSSKAVNNTALNRLFFFIQAWLGAVTIIIWIIIFFVNRYRQFKQAEEYDEDTISASDYSIVMTGMPLDVTLQEIQKSFNAYYLKITSEREIPQFRKRPLKVMKINIGRPFYMSQDALKDKELEGIVEQINNRKETLREWIYERKTNRSFSVEKTKRDEHYKRLAELMKLHNQKYIELKDKLVKKLKENDDNSDELTSVFVTFQTNVARNFVLHFHQLNIFQRIKGIFGKSNNYTFQRDNIEYLPSIQRAPEPQDIIWTNVGRSSCNTLMRKVFTYFVTAVLLGLCFLAVYFLSVAQQNSGNDRALSIVISIVIAVVNIILGGVIYLLTIIERDYTSTNRQASLAVKSIFAQMINSILIPVITAYYIKTTSGVYQTGGLVDNIFMMSITNSIVPPIVIIVNPAYLISKLIRFIKSKTSSKLYQNQKEHNILHEGVEFQVGYEYIYIVNLFMFVCFFVSLQPIITVIALIGYMLMYWAQKFTLFYRYKRPVPGTDFVNKVVYQLICIGPLIYSLGSLTWSNLDPNGIPPEALIPNLVAVAFSVLLIFLPMNPIIESCCFDDDRVVKVTKYEDDRIFFPSEYDRVNPSTSLEGLEDYKRFMEKKNLEMSKKSKEEQEAFNQRKLVQLQRGILNQVRQVSPFGANILNINSNPMQSASMNMAFDLANQAIPMSALLNPNSANPFAVNPYSNTLIPAAPFAFGSSGNVNPNW